MFARAAMLGALAALGLLASANPAEAFGKRSATTTVYYHCYYDPCCHHPWPHYPCCDPCHHYPCSVYVESPPPVPINGPFPTLVRGGQFGKGIIVEVDAPSGTASQPTGWIKVVTTSGPEMLYVGYNSHVLKPGMPGGPVRYRVFMCPSKAGTVNVDVEFTMSDGTVKKVPFAFNIQ